MILEKEILLLLNPRNINHFENLGYDIPRRRLNKKVAKSRLTVPKGTKILIKVDDLPNGSNVKVTKICDDCGAKTPNQSYATILNQRNNGDGKDRCFKCGGILSGKNHKNNVKYENSFEYYAKLNNKEYLLKEFSILNKKKINEISYGTEDKFIWDCPNCLNEYEMKLCNRTVSGYNCPFCCGLRVNHTNCLWTTHPEIAKLLKNPQIGYEVTAGSHRDEDFKCNECGCEKRGKISNIVIRGFSCLCSDGISYPEKFMMSLLNQINIKYKRSVKFNWSKNKLYDFYIENLNMIIETHGEQHYKGTFESIGGRSLIDEQENDKLKEKLAKENGIEHYIIIDCRKSEMDFIKNNILNSKLLKCMNLDNVDWLNCHEYALNSLVKIVCSLWDEIKSTLEIGKIVKLERVTVCRYLNQGVNLGWCDYDPKEETRKSGIISGINGKKLKKPIVQLSISGEYIRDWDSINEASIALQIHHTPIAKVCKRKPNYNTAGGFKWMFKEDYENMINLKSSN